MITFQNIYLFIGVTIAGLTALFQLYNSFKKPQNSIEKRQALDSQKENSEVKLLNAQLAWQQETALLQLNEVKDTSDRRFKEMNDRLSETLKMNLNHVHTIDVKIDALNSTVTNMNLCMSKQLTELQTIIAERIPSKTKNK